MTIIMETITYVSSHDLKGVVLILHLPVVDHPLLPCQHLIIMQIKISLCTLTSAVVLLW